MAEDRVLGRTSIFTVMKLHSKFRLFRGSYSVPTQKQLRRPKSVEIL